MNASNAVIVPSFLPPTLILRIRRGPVARRSSARSRGPGRACTGVPPAFLRKLGAHDRPGVRAELAAEAAADVIHLHFDVGGGDLQVGCQRRRRMPETFCVDGQTMIWSPLPSAPCRTPLDDLAVRLQAAVVITGMPYCPSETASASWNALSGSPVTRSPACLRARSGLRQVVVLHEVRQHFVIHLDLAGGFARDLFGGRRDARRFPSPATGSRCRPAPTTWTAFTPAIFSASLVSMLVTRACACGLVR